MLVGSNPDGNAIRVHPHWSSMDSTRVAILEEAVARVVPQGRRLGLVIGIDAYRDESGIPPLRAAVADAKAIHAVMVDRECGRFLEDHTVMLTDEQATDTNIRIALERLRKTATAADEVWFFYAGHALIVDGEHRLLPVNARREYLDATSVDFPALFNKIRCRRKIVFLDCCHAGATDTTTRNVHDVDEMLRNYQASGTITYCSSDGDQKSVELPEHGHGAFTYWLEKGLRGAADADGSGIVTSDELWQYVCEHVEQDAQRLTGRLQTPRLKLDASGSFPLSVNIAALRARHEAQQKVEAEQRARAERLDADIASLRQLLGDDDYSNLSTDELRGARALLRDEPSSRATQEIVRALDSYRTNQDANAAVLRIRGALVSSRHPSVTRPGPTAGPAGALPAPQRVADDRPTPPSDDRRQQRPAVRSERVPPARVTKHSAGSGTDAASGGTVQGSVSSNRADAAGQAHAPVGPTRKWFWPSLLSAVVIALALYNTLPWLAAREADREKLRALADTTLATPALPELSLAPITGTIHTINMRGDANGYYFEPRDVTIKAGDGVRFVMVSGGPHNVAFDVNALPESVAGQLLANMPNRMDLLASAMLVSSNEEYTISFGGVAAGTYAFYCSPHLSMDMKGTITVQ